MTQALFGYDKGSLISSDFRIRQLGRIKSQNTAAQGGSKGGVYEFLEMNNPP